MITRKNALIALPVLLGLLAVGAAHGAEPAREGPDTKSRWAVPTTRSVHSLPVLQSIQSPSSASFAVPASTPVSADTGDCGTARARAGTRCKQ